DFVNNIPCPDTETTAMQNYTHNYQYDELGNILQMQSVGNWTRNYVYNNPMTNNYLLGHGSGTVYTYDAHGNMLTMPHLTAMAWDYLDQLHSAGNGTFTSYYNYDAEGKRTRKVVVKNNIREERYYMGDYEVYRKYINNTLDTERNTLHISDDEKRFAIIDTLTVENGEELDPYQVTIRYQYDNHLGSACLELDGSASIISYEEYHPFGTTSYRSGRTETEVSLKRYKYCGKERDEETGLYYYGMRYYAAWICRFVSVDPLQFKYPHYTPYQYAGNKPITFIDLDGGEEADPKTGRITATIYFQFDVDTKQNTENTNTRALSDEQKQAYIDKFRENINTVWNSFTLADGTSVDVSGVEFLPAKEGMTASKLKSNEILLTVGYGENANPDAISGRSYIESDRKTGYMYHTENPTEAAHEFGHIMGLSDRYANVMQYAPNRSSEFNLLEANTIPLVLPKGESDYNPSTNLMSSHNGTSITQNQLSIVFAEGKTEENYQAPVVLIVNENSKLSPDAVSVKGNGVNYIVKGYKMEKGVLRSRTNSINWAAKNINRQNKSNVKNAYFQNRPNNW
ncbi:MAG: RHS repeat-associated core domain-containing protein, partial [Clostridiaceae bacterium]|nr:RHS repeat-associated core domain-containing protein [Clostridiaceae bacterium]